MKLGLPKLSKTIDRQEQRDSELLRILGDRVQEMDERLRGQFASIVMQYREQRLNIAVDLTHFATEVVGPGIPEEQMPRVAQPGYCGIEFDDFETEDDGNPPFHDPLKIYSSGE